MRAQAKENNFVFSSFPRRTPNAFVRAYARGTMAWEMEFVMWEGWGGNILLKY